MRPLNLTAEERRIAWHLIAQKRLEQQQAEDRARWAKGDGRKSRQYRYENRQPR